MIGQRFREILYFWWRHLGPLFLVSAPFALATEMLQWAFGTAIVLPETPDGSLAVSTASLVLIMLIRPLAEGTVITQLAASRSGKPAGLLACMAPALLMYPALLATYSIIAIGVALGWLAFFFPALWVYARLSFAPYLVVLHRQNPLRAIRQSFTMTEAQQWPLLLVIVLVFLAYMLSSSIIAGMITGAVSHIAAASLLIALPISVMATINNVTIFRFWELAGTPTQP
ncbi:MAG: hypothetical protein ACPH3N_11345 [Alcanivorax sediminis]|uniref:Glycerophosphoryl diester phosphodiesterase membrane domain-containing protein n=1 Tax=Alcanivorax sediminis TaxID=2663008 RepID=A0A6N7LX08_9GAMM|nr:hypothetical protein [Alcanivorax sediminis]MQX52660.1 hypothetical protein [Alcanivorax sediminis]